MRILCEKIIHRCTLMFSLMFTDKTSACISGFISVYQWKVFSLSTDFHRFKGFTQILSMRMNANLKICELMRKDWSTDVRWCFRWCSLIRYLCGSVFFISVHQWRVFFFIHRFSTTPSTTPFTTFAPTLSVTFSCVPLSRSRFVKIFLQKHVNV
jgi:hypothetical protein